MDIHSLLTMKHNKRLLCSARSIPAVVSPVMTSIVWADETKSVLLKNDLSDMHGKQATVLTVEFAPGASHHAHVHPGSVFAYVLEGAVVSQLEGEAPVTYTKGQSWYESPKKPHVVSRNASGTEPAKLLVLLIEPFTVPINDRQFVRDLCS